MIDQEQPATLLEWLRRKLADAEKSLRYREESEQIWRDKHEESWKAAARMKGDEVIPKKERLKLAKSENRIAKKCRVEVENYRAVIAILTISHVLFSLFL